jgi:hypothetical protein
MCSAGALADNIKVNFPGRCPPNGYNQPQPPFNNSLNGNGVNDSWSVPVTLTSGGNNVAATDAAGGTISLVCIPDPSGAGNGSDHYSPRFQPKGGGKPGTELGRCVYTCGRNTWILCSTFTGIPGVADQFTMSTWESRDGEQGGNWAFSGNITTFVADLTKAKIVAKKTETKVDVSPPGGTNGRVFYVRDATVVPIGADLGTVLLAGSPIGLPVPMPNSTNSPSGPPSEEITNSLSLNSLDPLPTAFNIGSYITVTGSLQNNDSVPHVYNFALFGDGIRIMNSLQPMALAPGEIESYSVAAWIYKYGDDALVSYAYDETGDPEHNSGTAVVIEAALPQIDTIALTSSNVMLNGSGATPGGIGYLVGSATLTAPITNLVATTTFDANGNFASSVPITGGTQYFRLVDFSPYQFAALATTVSLNSSNGILLTHPNNPGASTTANTKGQVIINDPKTGVTVTVNPTRGDLPGTITTQPNKPGSPPTPPLPINRNGTNMTASGLTVWVVVQSNTNQSSTITITVTNNGATKIISMTSSTDQSGMTTATVTDPDDPNSNVTVMTGPSGNVISVLTTTKNPDGTTTTSTADPASGTTSVSTPPHGSYTMTTFPGGGIRIDYVEADGTAGSVTPSGPPPFNVTPNIPGAADYDRTNPLPFNLGYTR